MKKRVTLLIAVAAILVFAAGAIAGSSIEAIQANLAHDIKFVVDGESWEATDGGVKQSPIVYNGKTYLPVRALGEALGVAVDWDNDTRTVYLGEKPAVQEPAVKEEPVVEEEPAVEEPAPAPAADLAIDPAGADLSKANVQDIPINITWGKATKITKIQGVASVAGLKIDPKEGTHYTVDGDVLTIKKELTSLIPVPMSMVPEGTTLTLTITFDDGSKDFVITVVK